MAIPKITRQNVLDALKYIDENGVPFHNQSTQYDLVSGNGKKYPPKYVIAVADHRNRSKKAFREVLIKSRLTAWHAIYLHIFRHLARKLLAGRQPSGVVFIQSDEKSDCASCAPDLISASLEKLEFVVE